MPIKWVKLDGESEASSKPKRKAAPQFYMRDPDGNLVPANAAPAPAPAPAPAAPAPAAPAPAGGALNYTLNPDQGLLQSAVDPMQQMATQIGQGVRQAAQRRGAQHQSQSFLPDPNVDYSRGVQDAALRYQLGAADTEGEAESTLNRRVGEGNWGRDWQGRLYVTPEGGRQLGMDLDRNTAIEEETMSLYDVADWGAAVPSIAAGTAGAMQGALLGAPAGPLGSLAGAVGGGVAGTALGSGGQELGEELAGINEEELGDVAKRVGVESLVAGSLEAIPLPVGRMVGRKVLRPGSVSPELQTVIDNATDLGIRPTVGQIGRQQAADLPFIPSSFSRVASGIFGDPKAVENARAVQKEFDRQVNQFGVAPRKGEFGRTVRSDVKALEDSFKAVDDANYKLATDVIGDLPVISTQGMKDIAQDYKKRIVYDSSGKPIGRAKEQKIIRDIEALPDNISMAQYQDWKEQFYDVSRGMERRKGLTKRMASELHRELVGDTLDTSILQLSTDPAMAAGVDALREAKRVSAVNRQRLDDSMVKRLLADPVKGGGVEPEKVFRTVWKADNADQLRRVMAALSPRTRQQVRSMAMQDLLAARTRNIPGDVTTKMVDGSAIQKTIDRIGEGTVEAAIGRDALENLKTFATVARLVETQSGSGATGFAATAMALNPDLTRVSLMRGIQRLIDNPVMFRYLTSGIEARPLRNVGDIGSRLTAYIAALGDQGELEDRPPESEALFGIGY